MVEKQSTSEVIRNKNKFLQNLRLLPVLCWAKRSTSWSDKTGAFDTTFLFKYFHVLMITAVILISERSQNLNDTDAASRIAWLRVPVQ